VVALLGGGIYWFTQQQAAEATEFEILRQAEVERNRITATVNATGSIEPETSVSLTFGAAGTIQQVEVVRGQTVTAGTVLATLNAAELQLAVQQAEDALRIQELTLQQRLNSEPSPATLASAQADIDAAQAQLSVAQANLAQAEAGVLQAQAQLAQLQAGPRPGDVAAAEAKVANARLQQQNAQIAYNQTIECFSDRTRVKRFAPDWARRKSRRGRSWNRPIQSAASSRDAVGRCAGRSASGRHSGGQCDCSQCPGGRPGG
jgi:multidrug efflux pump subunit AcrA (membrane-fusion protein)